MRVISLVVLLVLIGGCSTSVDRNLPLGVTPLISQIAELAGDWESMADEFGKKERVAYRVTSGGSAVEEILFGGSEHEMVSIYYQAGDQLRMTHYCMLGNQPELVARAMGPKSLIFKYDRGLNIDPQKDQHMHELHLTIIDPTHIRQEWIGYKDGKPDGDMVKIIDLFRKSNTLTPTTQKMGNHL